MISVKIRENIVQSFSFITSTLKIKKKINSFVIQKQKYYDHFLTFSLIGNKIKKDGEKGIHQRLD